MGRLTGKSALIFGADGITQGIAQRFLDEGATVAIIDDAAALERYDKPVGVSAFALSGRARHDIDTAVSRAVTDTLDILVIGGGDVPSDENWTGIDGLTESALSSAIDRDTVAALSVVQAAGSALKKQGGSIIFLFNPAGLYSEGGWGAAPAVHHAKRGLARALASEWGEYQIRVNTLATLARTAAYETYRARNPNQIDWRVSKIAMRRAGDPVRDIGGAAVFLASEDTRYLTGSLIFADGGAFLTSPVIETAIERVS